MLLCLAIACASVGILANRAGKELAPVQAFLRSEKRAYLGNLVGSADLWLRLCAGMLWASGVAFAALWVRGCL